MAADSTALQEIGDLRIILPQFEIRMAKTEPGIPGYVSVNQQGINPEKSPGLTLTLPYWDS